MSDFDTLFSESAGEVISELFGVELTYTSPGGTETEIERGTWKETEHRQKRFEDGEARIRKAVCIVEMEELSQPALEGTINKGGELWTIENYHRLPGLRWNIELVRSLSQEKSAGKYRTNRF